MPFNREKANKFSHERIINNQVIKEKIDQYRIICDIDKDNNVRKEVQFRFQQNEMGNVRKVDFIFTIDSSFTELPLNDDIPSAKMGIVNFSSNIINLNKKSDIYDKSGFINPQKYNEIYNSNILTFVCPTFNLVPKEDDSLSVVDSIRKEIYDFYYNNSPFNSVKLIESLFNVIREANTSLKLKCRNQKCKSNDKTLNRKDTGILVDLDKVHIEPFKCEHCGNIMYLTDYLRLHEAIDEEFGHSTVLTRFAQVTEHLISINLIDTLIKHKSWNLLTNTAFIIDGPLAIYGEPAKIHRSLLRYLHYISEKLENPIIYFGIIKSGRLKDHFTLLEKKIELEQNSFMLVDDSYRFKYIQKAPENNQYFGQEVSFGQDFLFYSKGKKRFVVSMLYPMRNKDINFKENAFDYRNYNNLSTVLNLINEISIDLYEDAILPLALAHKYAAISLNPGTNILEKFIKSNL